jgi:HTH-type transcriptional regulator/antitoxin HigA
MATRRPAEVFPPGDFLREELEERGWSQADLAEILGRPSAAVNEVIRGRRRITPDTATGLAAALGTSPEFWMNLEAAYQLWQVRSIDADSVSQRAQLYAKVPVRDMVRRGWIEPSKNIKVLEGRVLDFLGVSSITEEPMVFQHAARKSSSYAAITPAQTAWLLRARQLAQTVQAGRYSTQSSDRALVRLRELLHAPQEVRHVSRILSEAGVRLVIVEPLSGGKIDGATFWLDKSAPVIALTMRYDRLDYYWFTLLHELSHVRSGEEVLDSEISMTRAGTDKPEGERRADEFASRFLIEPQQMDNFIARVRPLYSTRRIEGFARTILVHPAIVVGQLQFREEVGWSSFRKLLVPVRDMATASTIADGWGSVLPAQL